MDELQRNYITQNISDLVDFTMFNTTCAAVLEEKGVFGKDDLAILASIQNEREKVRCFYHLVMQKANSYEHLITALERGFQTGAVQILNQLTLETETLRKKPRLTFTVDTNKYAEADSSGKMFGEQNFLPIRFEVLDPVLLFTGRVKELEQLHQKLQLSDTKVAVISQIASIVGLGGIGKTELARAYVQKYHHQYDNNLIWFNAETEKTLTKGFRRSSTDHLKLSTLNVDGKEKQIASIIDGTYNFFSGRRSLFVFDNADSNEIIHKFMPFRVTDKPYLLITSRDKDWSFNVEMLELREMDEKEAIEFMKNGLQIENGHQDENIIQLVKKLQYFPLAMSQAISYIKQKQRLLNFDICDYLKLFESSSERLLNSNRPAAAVNSYTKTTMTTWTVTTDLISKNKEIGDQAMWMLHMISYFQSNKIPTKCLLSYNVDNEKSETVQQQNEDVLSLLEKYSMVNIQPLQKTISIHQLVQEVTRKHLKQKQMEEGVLKNAMKFMSGNIDFDCINHAFSVFKYCATYRTLVLEFKEVPWNLMRTFVLHGGAPSALNIAIELREMLLKHISSDDVDFVRFEKQVAGMEKQLGGYQRSLQILDRILPLYEANKTGLFSENGAFQAQQLSAYVLKELGRRSESLEFLFKSYQKFSTMNGVNDWQTIRALADVANCLRELGHFSFRTGF